MATPESEKVRLVLFHGEPSEAELVALYTALTGRVPTPEEIEESRAVELEDIEEIED